MALDQSGFANVDLKVEDFLVDQAVFQLGFLPARIDLMAAVSGVEFTSAYGLRLEVNLDDIRINVINRCDFIRNKRATGRPKDFADLKELEVNVTKSGDPE